MEASQQLSSIERASLLTRSGHIDEVYRPAPIQPAHPRDFSPAQGAATIIPDDQIGHDVDMGSAGPLSSRCDIIDRRAFKGVSLRRPEAKSSVAG